MFPNCESQRILRKMSKNRKPTSLSYIFKDLPKCALGHRTEYIMLMCWLSFPRTPKPYTIHRICKKLLRELEIPTTETKSNRNKKVVASRNGRIL